MPIVDLDEASQALVAAAIRGSKPDHEVSPEEMEHAIYVHTIHRVVEFRNNVITWLRTFCEIGPGKRVLEIGAGTGASVIALAETGAWIDGVDVKAASLKIAELRLRLHGYDNARVLQRNAVDIGDLYDSPYDLIIYSAAFEHMTYEERLTSLRAAWANLRPGGVLCVYETPNRLWYYDGHTSLLNFFHWLPDDLAMDYARFSPRKSFDTAFDDGPAPIALARWGRGASFHEFELAIGLARMEVQTSLHQHLSDVHPHYRARYEGTIGSRYSALLAEVEPGLHPAFLEEVLNFAAIKRG